MPCSVPQARYFKSMLEAADHLKKVKRMRVGEKDVEALLPYYEVRCAKMHFLLPAVFYLLVVSQVALDQLKDAYMR